MIIKTGNPEAPMVLIHIADAGETAGIEAEITGIRNQTKTPFCLLTFTVSDWNEDLSPWEAPAVFGKQHFGNGAARTLTEILPYCKDPGKKYILGGYSLAGLFALWAAYQTDVFFAVAAASPSMWFPGFTEYMKKHPVKAQKVYLSLGDREEKARNPVMATVGTRIREAKDLLQEAGIQTMLEWNPGNHFMDMEKRMAKAFAWTMWGN